MASLNYPARHSGGVDLGPIGVRSFIAVLAALEAKPAVPVLAARAASGNRRGAIVYGCGERGGDSACAARICRLALAHGGLAATVVCRAPAARGTSLSAVLCSVYVSQGGDSSSRVLARGVRR